VGRFFATVNVSACFLQCFVLPHVLSQRTLPHVLLYLPLIVFLAVLLGVFNPGIISVMLGFGTIKVLEYSVMTAASEMIYMPMDRDVRYLGKELIKFFGHKLGKSAASLILSYFIARLAPTLSTQSVWGAVFTGCWTVTL
jgi:ATP/ADP translocase